MNFAESVDRLNLATAQALDRLAGWDRCRISEQVAVLMAAPKADPLPSIELPRFTMSGPSRTATKEEAERIDEIADEASRISGYNVRESLYAIAGLTPPLREHHGNP